MKRKTCLPELVGGGGGGILRMSKIEHEGINTCARIEISQDAGNADQKVKLFLKVQKMYKLLWEAYFSNFCSQVFTHVHILQIFRY